MKSFPGSIQNTLLYFNNLFLFHQVTFGLPDRETKRKVNLFQHQSIEDETKEYSRATGQWLTYKYKKPSGKLSLTE